MQSLNLIKYEGEVYLYKGFLSSDESQFYFSTLSEYLDWQEEYIKIYGKQIKVPRLVCWYGDPGANYRYSGVTHEPLPWTQELVVLRNKINELTGHQFNSVLGNLYRGQNDSMGWHADKEKELGINPVIASLSLGEARLFKLQHNKTKEIVDVILEPGSLLLMQGAIQHHWRHCVPKVKRALAPRINLTFRKIIHLS